MFITKKNRIAVYSYLFKEGVCVAKKDCYAPKHEAIDTVSNLEVMMLMKSLVTRGYVRETFSWQYFYWYLTQEGIEHLQEYLNLPADIVPATLKKRVMPARGMAPERAGPGGFNDKSKRQGPGSSFNPNFEGGYRK